MNELSRLQPPPGSGKQRKRVGRGPGSGRGRYSGRGIKGQGSRSGKGKRPWFEGGQMPLVRRVPKRGFSPLVRKEFAIVNVESLDEKFEDGALVDVESLKKVGLVKQVKDGVKILGRGEVTKKLHVVAHYFSKAAREKIEKAGGSARTVLEEDGAKAAG